MQLIRTSYTYKGANKDFNNSARINIIPAKIRLTIVMISITVIHLNSHKNIITMNDPARSR